MSTPSKPARPTWESWKPEDLAAEMLARMNHFYRQMDGTLKFPNSAEGDLLKLAYHTVVRSRREPLVNSRHELVLQNAFVDARAVTCRRVYNGLGTTFHFLNASGTCQVSFSTNDTVSPAPPDALGAVRLDDGAWYWIVALRQGQPAPEPPVSTALSQLFAIHAELLERNPYCYCEVAHTRSTGWMAWLCSNSAESDPNREVLAQGQGATPEEAASIAVKAYNARNPARS